MIPRGRIVGPVCYDSSLYEIDEGTMCRIPVSCPGFSIDEYLQTLRTESDLVTAEQLSQILGNLGGRAGEVARDLNLAFKAGEITNSLGAAMFIAQAAHESQNFTKLAEGGGNVYYNTKTNTKLKHQDGQAIFGKDKDVGKYDYFAFMYDPESPSTVGKNQAANVGNTTAGDGVKYKGRGYLQITGRWNYTKAGKDLNLPLVEKPELLEIPVNAARVSGWFWKFKKLNKFTVADTDANFESLTKKINTASLGLVERKKFYSLAKIALGITKK